jgi:hypothetical protein
MCLPKKRKNKLNAIAYYNNLRDAFIPLTFPKN